MFPPHVLADRAILSCIREVPGYVTCNMPKAIRLYWFSDPCCVGLGIFCSLLSEHSVFGRDVRTPMSQWKESPWHLSFSISRLLILGWEIQCWKMEVKRMVFFILFLRICMWCFYGQWHWVRLRSCTISQCGGISTWIFLVLAFSSVWNVGWIGKILLQKAFSKQVLLLCKFAELVGSRK